MGHYFLVLRPFDSISNRQNPLGYLTCSIVDLFRCHSSGALGLGHLARDSVLAVDDIRHAQAAVWDSLDDTIFWSDYKSVSVSRSRRDGSEQRVIISTDLGTRPSGERLAWCGRSPVFCF